MTQFKLLSVKAASQLCYQLNLPRSSKTIRRWCINRDIEAEKRPNGRTEQWFINRLSLEIKIKEELEFLKQSDSYPNSRGRQADMSGHDQTQLDVSGHERTQAGMAGHEGGQRADTSSGVSEPSLREEIASLKIEVRFNEKMTEQFKKQYLKSQEALIAQSRYIGHIETQLYSLGERPDQAFLKAPVPKSSRSEGDDLETNRRNPKIFKNMTPHPDQADLHSG